MKLIIKNDKNELILKKITFYRGKEKEEVVRSIIHFGVFKDKINFDEKEIKNEKEFYDLLKEIGENEISPSRKSIN